MHSKYTVAGLDFVTIPASDYADLLHCRRKLAEASAMQRALKTVSTSPIERDPEVATFLASHFGLATVAVIREQCLALFGRARTPSQSAVFRYWSRLRG